MTATAEKAVQKERRRIMDAANSAVPLLRMSHTAEIVRASGYGLAAAGLLNANGKKEVGFIRWEDLEAATASGVVPVTQVFRTVAGAQLHFADDCIEPCRKCGATSSFQVEGSPIRSCVSCGADWEAGIT